MEDARRSALGEGNEKSNIDRLSPVAVETLIGFAWQRKKIKLSYPTPHPETFEHLVYFPNAYEKI